MTKYNYGLDLSSGSMDTILMSRIKNNSIVLEFGCAHGRMTKFMVDNKYCEVYCVELDPDSAKDAAQYCKDIVIGNIEDYLWCEKYNEFKFDIILFADVLEDIHNPWEVLKKCKPFLKFDGSILISIPNIAHNAIITSLINDRFDYQQTGLLDNAHIRFFTKFTLDKMVQDCGYSSVFNSASYIELPSTEFPYSYNQLDINMARLLSAREFGEVYQFCYEIKNSDFVSSNNITLENKMQELSHIQLYLDCGDGFNSELVINEYNINDGVICLDGYNKINQFRFNPSHKACKLKVISFSVSDSFGNTHNCSILEHNAFYVNDMEYVFFTDDPQFILSCDIGDPVTFIYKTVHLNLYEDNTILGVNTLINQISVVTQNNQELIKENQLLGDKNQVLVMQLETFYDYKRELQVKNNLINQMDIICKEQEAKINEMNAGLHNKDVQLNDVYVMQNELLNSRSWKITRPLRYITQIAKDVKRKLRSIKSRLSSKKVLDSHTDEESFSESKDRELITNEYTDYYSKIRNYIASKSVAESEVFLLFSHSLDRSGAPILLLHLVNFLVHKMGYAVILLTLNGGELLEEFEASSCVINLDQNKFDYIVNDIEVELICSTLCDLFVSRAILNTCGGCLLIPYMEKYGFKYVVLVHELPGVIKRLGWSGIITALFEGKTNRSQLIFSSENGYNQFVKSYDVILEKYVYSQGCVLEDVNLKRQSKNFFRKVLKINKKSKVILGAGKDFYRKGVDLFYEIAMKATQLNPDLVFVWCGHLDEPEMVKLQAINENKNIKFIEFIDSMESYINLLSSVDLFALTSREDPFPNVVLDSLFCGTPVIAYKECGGASEVIGKLNDLLLIDEFDNDIFVQHILYVLDTSNRLLYKKISDDAKLLIRQQYSFYNYVNNLLEFFKPQVRVTVVIPNYNYETYLPQRIESILSQTVKPFEIIFLDDKSSDNSVEVAVKLLKDSGIPYSIIVNEQNIGVFKQWTKGIRLAKGDYVWIAEADDYCDKGFLEELVKELILDSNINLAYCQSRIIGINNEVISDNVLQHTDALSETKWKFNFKDSGKQIVEEYFIHRNIVVNVSGCIFRRAATNIINFVQLESFKYCGDWFFYVSLLSAGKIFYSCNVLNYYRKHIQGVTLKNQQSRDYLNEIVDIKKFIINNFAIDFKVFQRSKNFVQSDFNFDNSLVDRLFMQLGQEFVKGKILFVSTNPSAMIGGGSEILWQEVAISLSKTTNFEIAIYLEFKHLLKDNISVFVENGISVYYGEEDGHGCLLTFNPDLVVFSQGDHNEGTSWYYSCKELNIDYVIVNQLVKEGFWPNDASYNLIQNFYMGAKSVFFTCDHNKVLMERQIGARLTHAKQHFNPVSIGRDSKLTYPSSNQFFYLACPGRFTVLHKGQDLLLEVMNDKKWKNRNLVINLYGHGENQEQLENLKRYYSIDNVIFNGYQTNILNIWQKNHGIIMPSRFEGVPIVLLGAMLCARLPILTDVGGHRELVSHGVSGFIAKAPTVELIDEALELAWQNRLNWKEIGTQARASVLNFMPEDPIADFIEKLKL